MNRMTRPALGLQRGASMTEFLIVAPVLVLLGLGALQIGLIYHGKSIVNYATFEAARTGAVHHALPAPMRRELGTRLAPLAGGDGSMAMAASAIARSRIDIDTTLAAKARTKPLTELKIISPTAAAFDSWGYDSEDAGRKVIPNSHLRHTRGPARGTPPLTLTDANLLKIEVTHGLELKVPLVNGLLTTALAKFDPANRAWYDANRLPLRAVATVRMQSEAWIDAIEPDSPGVVPEATEGEPSDVVPAGDPDALVSSDGEEAETDCKRSNGLGDSPALLATASYENGKCTSADAGFGAGGSRDTIDLVEQWTTPDC